MKYIDEIIMFLNGKEEKLVEVIENKMKDASEKLDFESAARYRDQFNSLNIILEKQKVVSTNVTDQDVIGMAKGTDDSCVQIFFIRGGKIIGREHFILEDTFEEERGRILSSFIKQFYIGTAYVPKEIYVETEFEDMELISKWLGEKRGSKVKFKIPQRGEKSQLMEMVKDNAQDMLIKHSEEIKKKKMEKEGTLLELKNILSMDKIPMRIEAYDISDIQGIEPVGSMVVYENGDAKKSDYRRFKIRTVTGPNDYASMEEIIKRRFKRGVEERENFKEKDIRFEGFSSFPDLIMIDGGKGQVSIAEEVIDNMGIRIPVCGLVKDDYHRTRGIVYNGREIYIEKNSPLFRFITRVQDEAHRFAISYHRSLRSKDIFKSQLDDIRGIGKKRKVSLLKHFGSVENIKNASLEELKKAEGMNIKAAEEVYNYFRK